EGDVATGLRDGKLSFALDGERLSGRWTLVRMARKDTKRKSPDNWLLIKRSDAVASKAETKKTVTTKRGKAGSNGNGTAREALPARAASAKAVPGGRRAPLPKNVSPQLATLAVAPVQGPEWLHEQKLDGYRLLCRIERGRVRLTTRRGNEWTTRFPRIAE